MDLSDKIKQILVNKDITPSIFADEIGIQRSSMSHILAGRNKPSLDIVQKIIRRFPDLGVNWILEGEDLPEKEHARLDLRGNVPRVESAKEVKHMDLKQKGSPGKQIERILVFYTDGTYKEFREA